MSKTTLIFVRHGYSEGNEKKIFTGWYNVGLNEQGKKQAKLTAEYLKDYDIDRLYCSDLKRAVETAQEIGEIKDLKIETDSNLREINGGDWESRPFEDLPKLYPKEYKVWLDDIGKVRCTNGESVKELQNRVVYAVERIAKENRGKTVCIVTHATPIRVLTTYWLGKKIEYASEIPYVPNSSITIVEYDGDKASIKVNGFARHMGDLKTNLPVSV